MRDWRNRSVIDGTLVPAWQAAASKVTVDLADARLGGQLNVMPPRG